MLNKQLIKNKNDFSKMFKDYLDRKMLARSMMLSLDYMKLIKFNNVDQNNITKIQTKLHRLNNDIDKISKNIEKADFYSSFIDDLQNKALIHYKYLSIFINDPTLYENDLNDTEQVIFEDKLLSALSNPYNFLEFVVNFDNFGFNLSPEKKYLWEYQKDIYKPYEELNNSLNNENIFYIYQNLNFIDNNLYELETLISEWLNQDITFDNGYGLEIQKLLPAIFQRSLYVENREILMNTQFFKKIFEKVNGLEENEIPNLFKNMPSLFVKELSDYVLTNKDLNIQLEAGILVYLIKKSDMRSSLKLLQENFIFTPYTSSYSEVKDGVFELVKEHIFSNNSTDMYLNKGFLSFDFEQFLNREKKNWESFQDALNIERKIGKENIFKIQKTKSFVVDLKPLCVLLNKYNNFYPLSFELNFDNDLFSLSSWLNNNEDYEPINILTLSKEVDDNFNLERVFINVANNMDCKNNFTDDDEAKREFEQNLYNAIREEILTNSMATKHEVKGKRKL